MLSGFNVNIINIFGRIFIIRVHDEPQAGRDYKLKK